MTQIIDGKAYAATLKETLKSQVSDLLDRGVKLKLSVLLVGDDEASALYAEQKRKNCAAMGVDYELTKLPATATQEQVLDHVRKLNADDTVTAIMVEMPLPKGLNAQQVQETIAPEKDIDGANPINLGRLTSGLPNLTPCTSEATVRLAEAQTDLKGKKVVVVGRSVVVGKPAALLALEKNATVTICHSRTPDLAAELKSADVVIAAVGKAGLITGSMIKEGAIVIDAGINSKEGGGITGDCDFESMQGIAGAITPVPGGVGPVTNANLLANILKAAHLQGKA